MLISHAPEFYIPARQPEEWKTLFGNYLEALAPLPLYAVEEAFLRWNRGECYPDDLERHRVYPKPAELFQLGQKARGDVINALFRARRAATEALKAPTAERTAEKRKADREEMIRKGWLTPEGKVVLGRPKGIPPAGNVSHETPQQMAERLRRAGDEEAV